jgi:hypothetical protein
MNEYQSRFEPIEDDYSTCQRTDATLAIYHVDPDLITHKLGIKPTSCMKKGAPNIMPSGVERIGRINNWMLSSENEVKSKDLRRHLDWVLDKIEPASKQLFELQQLPDVRMVLHCSWWGGAPGGAGPMFWPIHIERMAKLNVEVWFSFGTEEEDE